MPSPSGVLATSVTIVFPEETFPNFELKVAISAGGGVLTVASIVLSVKRLLLATCTSHLL